MRWKDHWPMAMTGVIFITTVACASAAIRVMREAAGAPIAWPPALVWQGLIYGAWLPFAGIILWLVRRLGLTARLILILYPVIIAYTALHAVSATWIDARFGGWTITFSHWMGRLPVDILIATAIATLVAAIRGHCLTTHAREQAAGLQRALDEARRPLRRPSDLPDRLPVSIGRRIVQVPVSDIEWCAAAGNYVVINWETREGLIRETLGALAGRLDTAVFVRAHRSTLVNLAKVRSTQTLSDGAWILTTESGADLVVSRTYRDDVLARLGLASALAKPVIASPHEP